MNFRTELNPPKIYDLGIETKFYSIGSCFANMIGSKLNDFKFDGSSNPYGVIYNPVSIFNLLGGKTKLESSMVENDHIWYNYHLHSDFRNDNKNELVEQINATQEKSTDSLEKANVLIITFGTAFVYKLKESNEYVANCHKVPQKQFTKELLSVKQIIAEFEKNGIDKLCSKIILTVSPVRHTKDTIELNSVSKSNLRLACHELQKQYENVHYFPSYELMMDDLRDYRYYKDDLLHPTPFAENYIWDKFKNSIFNSKALDFIEEWTKIKSGLEHKPFCINSEKHQSFLKKQLEKLKELNNKVDCNQEIELIEKQLTLS